MVNVGTTACLRRRREEKRTNKGGYEKLLRRVEKEDAKTEPEKTFDCTESAYKCLLVLDDSVFVV